MEGLPHAKRGERDYLNALTYSVQSPPIVVRDVVITPASISDRRIMRESIPGWIRGFNVRTGELEWVFHTVPQAGDEGVETWKNESWRYSGNTNGHRASDGRAEVLRPVGDGAATDYLRGDVYLKGGITSCMKTAHLAEAFQMNYEGASRQ